VLKVELAHSLSRSLWCEHYHIGGLWWRCPLPVYRCPVRERERGALLKVRCDLLLEEARLLHVRDENVDYVRLLHGLCDGHHLVALALGLIPALASLSQS